MSSFGSGWGTSSRTRRSTNAAISTLAIAALFSLSTLGAAPPAYGVDTPGTQPTPKVSVRAAEDDEDLDEEDTDEDRSQASDDAEAQEDKETPTNAELPDEGTYTCVRPGEHYLAASLGEKLPRVFFRDQTVTPHQQRENYSVVVPVPDKAKRSVDDNDIQAGFGVVAPRDTVLWTLPQDQHADYAWISLDTQSWDYTRTSDDGVRFSVNYLEGPGTMKMWMHSPEKGVQLLVDSQKKEETGIITQEPGVIHLATSFDAPGFYELDYNFKGFPTTLENSRQYNAAFNMYYAVGDDMIRKVCGDSFIPASQAEETTDATQPAGSESNANAAASDETGEKFSESPSYLEALKKALFGEVKNEESTASPERPSADSTETSAPAASGQEAPATGSTASPTSDNSAQTAPTNATSTTSQTAQTGGAVNSPQAASTNTSEQTQAGQGAAPNSLPTTPVPVQKEPQTSTTENNPAPENKQKLQNKKQVSNPTGQKGSSTPASVEPTSGVLESQTAAPSKSASASVTDQACEAVVITREAEPSDMQEIKESAGQAGVAKTTLTFSVGDEASGNATDGHFDLGPIIENGTVYARVKDDRTQPAQWFDPTQMIFALGSASAITAPDALDFVASPGKTVWMIQQTQQAHVPWVGMNSQHESILANTTGEVTFTLESVDGPGKVAVFESGAFGNGIGRLIFSAAGSSFTLPANTHAHQNWVFTEPGVYTLNLSMAVTGVNGEIKGSGVNASGLIVTGETGPNGRPMVQQTVGRTADGHDCDLKAASSAGNGGKAKGNGSLAKTGALAVLPAAIALLATGSLMRVHRKRGE